MPQQIPPVRVPRTNLIDGIPKPITQQPIFQAPPITRTLEQPVIEMPAGDIPSYEPIQPPPPEPDVDEAEFTGAPVPVDDIKRITEEAARNAEEDTREMDEEEEVGGGEEQLGSDLDPAAIPTDTPAIPQRGTVIEIPIIDVEVPVPTSTEVTLAGTTAVATTAAVIAGRSLVDQLLRIFKPIAKQLILKAKKALKRDLTEYEEQLHWAFEEQRKASKLLKKEAKAARLQQYEAEQQRQRRRRSPHKVILDEK